MAVILKPEYFEILGTYMAVIFKPEYLRYYVLIWQ
jgi:hypothetical protein